MEQAAVVGIDEVRRIRVRIQKREGAVAYGRRHTAGIGRQIASRAGDGGARAYCQISLRRRAVIARVDEARNGRDEIRARRARAVDLNRMTDIACRELRLWRGKQGRTGRHRGIIEMAAQNTVGIARRRVRGRIDLKLDVVDRCLPSSLPAAIVAGDRVNRDEDILARRSTNGRELLACAVETLTLVGNRSGDVASAGRKIDRLTTRGGRGERRLNRRRIVSRVVALGAIVADVDYLGHAQLGEHLIWLVREGSRRGRAADRQAVDAWRDPSDRLKQTGTIRPCRQYVDIRRRVAADRTRGS